MMGNIKLGVIADDFTGASDAASFLVKAGYRVILLTDVRGVQPLDCDCVVVAQKIRSVPPKEAIRQVQAALGLFRALGVRRYTTNIVTPSTPHQREISESSGTI